MKITIQYLKLKMYYLWIAFLKFDDNSYRELFSAMITMKKLGIAPDEMIDEMKKYDHWLFKHIRRENIK